MKCLLYLNVLIAISLLAERGSIRGILSSKGDTWIEILDDQDQSFRFIPEWAGKGPANGGKFKTETIEMIEQLIVGNRVEVKWMHDGFLRILDARTIRPSKKEGVFVGYILKMSNRWIDLQNIDEGKPWRFYLPWVGGLPEQGGGYDQKVFKAFKYHKPYEPIRFSWVYKNRPTIVSTYETVRDTFVPFWVGKKFNPVRVRIEGSSKPPAKDDLNQENLPASGSPFDMIKTANGNPFDQAPSRNPFELLSPKSPFDQIEKKQSVGNPFDQINNSVKPDIIPEKNPFDLSVDTPGNPFDMTEN